MFNVNLVFTLFYNERERLKSITSTNVSERDVRWNFIELKAISLRDGHVVLYRKQKYVRVVFVNNDMAIDVIFLKFHGLRSSSITNR